MTPPPGPEPMVLRPGLRSLLVLLLLVLCFCAAGAGCARLACEEDGLWRWAGWAGVAFFALGILCLMLMMLPGSSSLRLDASGFAVRHLFRTLSYTWDEVGAFAVASVRGDPRVVFNFAPERARPGLLAWPAAGFQGSLPDTYGLGAEELAALLNDWRRRHAG